MFLNVGVNNAAKGTQLQNLMNSIKTIIKLETTLNTEYKPTVSCYQDLPYFTSKVSSGETNGSRMQTTY